MRFNQNDSCYPLENSRFATSGFRRKITANPLLDFIRGKAKQVYVLCGRARASGLAKLASHFHMSVFFMYLLEFFSSIIFPIVARLALA